MSQESLRSNQPTIWSLDITSIENIESGFLADELCSVYSPRNDKQDGDRWELPLILDSVTHAWDLHSS